MLSVLIIASTAFVRIISQRRRALRIIPEKHINNTDTHGCMTQRAQLQNIIIHQGQVKPDSVKVGGTVAHVVQCSLEFLGSREGMSGSLRWRSPKAHFVKECILVSFSCDELWESGYGRFTMSKFMY